MKRTHRKKELTEIQRLKKTNRDLESENRNLKKELRRLQKKEHSFEEITYSDPEEVFQEPQITKCAVCGKGSIQEVIVAGRYFTRCDTCTFRSKTVII